jgi:short-subunit dehydrogenase involved in D-alanine esterification of teichoic acids
MTATLAGRKLVAAGGGSGIGRDTAADVVAGEGSAIITGREQARVDETVVAPPATVKGPQEVRA